jgi:Arc/MetJ family transcription regulator
MSLTLEGPKLQVMVEAPLDRLDEAIRRSAGGGWLKMLGVEAESWENLKQRIVENWDVVVDAAVRRLSEGVRGELEALRNKLNNDKIAREVVAPALLLIQAEKLGVNEETLKYFAAVISSTIGGDGYVSAARREVGLSSGEPAVDLLWAAVLAAYSVKTKVEKVGSAFRVVASDDDAIKLAGLYFRYGSPLLEEDERTINHKLAEAVKLGAEGLNIRWEGLRRRTEKGYVAADLIISEEDVEIKYNVYLWEKISLEFLSTDRSRAELAARLLKLAGVSAELKKKEGGRDEWYVKAATDRLAAGREELRDALAEIVKTARGNGWVDADKAKRWLEKLEGGLTLKEGWPKYLVRLIEGALVVRFSSPNPDGIEREAQRLREMGLEEDKHFTVKMPKGDKRGYVLILKDGLEHAAWLSLHGEGERQKLVAEFVEYILQRARDEGEDVYKKALEVVEEGKARGSLTLKGLERKVEVGATEHVVKIIDGGAEFDEGRSGKKLLRIKITAEVDGVRREYAITFGRYGKDNVALGYAAASAKAPGGRKADAERLSALVKALTGKEPRIIERSDGTVEVVCGREHLDGFMRYTELSEAIARWLEETKR